MGSSQTRGRILSPALAGRFFTTEPPGKSRNPLFFKTEKIHPVLGTNVSELYAKRVLFLASFQSNSPHFSLYGSPLPLSQPSQPQLQKKKKQKNKQQVKRKKTIRNCTIRWRKGYICTSIHCVLPTHLTPSSQQLGKGTQYYIISLLS